jgi:hypothetical protein
MAYRSKTFYTGTGSSQNLSVTFPYLDISHVHVYLADVLQEDDTWSWLNDSTITLTAGTGTAIELRRTTPLDPMVTFTNASLLNQDDQNMAALQAIYLIEEGADFGYLLNEEVNQVQTQTDVAVVFVIDAGGVVISTGLRGCLYIPFNGTIISANILADVSGSIVVDIWKDVYANYPPADADSICASAPLTIANATHAAGVVATWNKTITAGDVLSFNIDSIDVITRITITLVVRKS